jgi:hypothetical protein
MPYIPGACHGTGALKSNSCFATMCFAMVSLQKKKKKSSADSPVSERATDMQSGVLFFEENG